MALSVLSARLRRFGAVAVTVLGLCAVGLPAMTVPSQPAEAAVAVSVGVGGWGWGWWGYRPYWRGYGYHHPYGWGYRGYYRPYWHAYYHPYYRWGWRGGCGWHRCW